MRSLAANIDFLHRLPKLSHLNGFGLYGGHRVSGARSPLVEMTDFGANPGALRMSTYVPPNLPSRSALVVVLHGCGQDAAGYDLGLSMRLLIGAGTPRAFLTCASAHLPALAPADDTVLVILVVQTGYRSCDARHLLRAQPARLKLGSTNGLTAEQTWPMDRRAILD